MGMTLYSAFTRLDKGRLMRIEDGRGKGVAVLGGPVWITQDNDPRDIYLEDGETFVFDRPGLSIVQALEASSVLVFDAGRA